MKKIVKSIKIEHSNRWVLETIDHELYYIAYANCSFNIGDDYKDFLDYWNSKEDLFEEEIFNPLKKYLKAGGIFDNAIILKDVIEIKLKFAIIMAQLMKYLIGKIK